MIDIESQLKKQIKLSDNSTVDLSYADIVLDRTKGREFLNTSFPQEFEYYACALEITDSEGEVLEFFSFPLMPQSISESTMAATNIKKTLGGVVVTNHSTFVPFDISINGHFGRKFRRVDYKAVSSSNKTSNAQSTGDSEGGIIEGVNIAPKANVFSSDYKTGYGCTKIIEKIFKRAQSETDANRKPLRLYFYNLSLNSNYLVEPVNLLLSQTREQNMIWNYSLQLKAIAPAKFVNSNYKNSIERITNYSRKYVRMNQQSSLINEMLKDVINGMTPVESALNRFQNYKAYAQQSGFKLLKQLTDNPIDNVDFIKNRR